MFPRLWASVSDLDVLVLAAAAAAAVALLQSLNVMAL